MSKTVKSAILSPALRAVGQQTKFKQATPDDYNDAFDFYVEMRDFWVNDRGVVLYSETPTSMNDPVGTDDPIQALKENLILYIADHFFYSPTPLQGNKAARSFKVLKARQRGKALMSLPNRTPRGSGNTWRNTFLYGDCGENGSQAVVTETNVQVITE